MHIDLSSSRQVNTKEDPVGSQLRWRSGFDVRAFDELFSVLGKSLSDCTSYAFDLHACDVVGDMAYTAGLEHISASIDGQPRTYTLRATRVYRREAGEWRVAHRHGDTVTG
jgi:ketosteroid isomerase-like protein